MSEDKQLGEELLRLNGLSEGAMIAEERRKLDEVLQRERKLNRLLMRVSVGALITGIAAFALSAVLWGAPEYQAILNLFVIGCICVWIGAFLLAILRERSINNTELKIRLANIEMLLRTEKKE
ncbi:MAG: hypothetical protein HYZ00_09745 [Candidatus Hydrogenedentes bacterium]|nr:hypothetical protein [Candidatus Hydrogenedentota bacterium]